MRKVTMTMIMTVIPRLLNDPHIWLSLENGKVIASGIADELTRIDPQNAAIYSENLVRFLAEADKLKAGLEATLKPVTGRNFLVFHDAYQYFETEFGLRASGTFSFNPEIKPGARKIRELSASLEKREITCVFSEPQFDPKPITIVLEDAPQNRVKTGLLDPLGSTMEPGPQHYFHTLEAMAKSFATCLD